MGQQDWRLQRKFTPINAQLSAMAADTLFRIMYRSVMD